MWDDSLSSMYVVYENDEGEICLGKEQREPSWQYRTYTVFTPDFRCYIENHRICIMYHHAVSTSLSVLN